MGPWFMCCAKPQGSAKEDCLIGQSPAALVVVLVAPLRVLAAGAAGQALAAGVDATAVVQLQLPVQHQLSRELQVYLQKVGQSGAVWGGQGGQVRQGVGQGGRGRTGACQGGGRGARSGVCLHGDVRWGTFPTSEPVARKRWSWRPGCHPGHAWTLDPGASISQGGAGAASSTAVGLGYPGAGMRGWGRGAGRRRRPAESPTSPHRPLRFLLSHVPAPGRVTWALCELHPPLHRAPATDVHAPGSQPHRPLSTVLLCSVCR